MGSAPGDPRWIAPWLTTAIVAVAWSLAGASGPPAPAFDVTRFLTAEAGFSAAAVRRLERGEVVAKGLPADESTIAIVTAALMSVSPEFFLSRFRQIEEFRESAEVQQIGRLDRSPSASELAGLTLESSELDDARECRVGDCAFKLDAPGIERMRATRDDGAAMAALRAHLAEYVAGYLRQGNAALMEYRDRARPLALSAQLHQIIEASPYLARNWPDLQAAVGAFRGALPQDLEQFIYWSKERVGPRPVVSLTHVIIGPSRDGVATIASKQVYASHYTTGSLGFSILVDRTGNTGPRMLIIYINRTRVDVFDGVLGALKRPIVRSRARSGAERMMTGLRTRLERDFKHGLHGLDGFVSREPH